MMCLHRLSPWTFEGLKLKTSVFAFWAAPLCLRPKEAPVAALEHGLRILEMRWNEALIKSSMKLAADTVSRKLVHARSVCPVPRLWYFQLKRFISLQFTEFATSCKGYIHNTQYNTPIRQCLCSCILSPGWDLRGSFNFAMLCYSFRSERESESRCAHFARSPKLLCLRSGQFYNWRVGDRWGRLEVMNLMCFDIYKCQQGCMIHGITFGKSKHPLVACNGLWNEFWSH